jgi:membrane associated rhomboid family serine protease
MNAPIRLTPAVKWLLIASFAMFLIQQTVDQFFGGNLLGVFALVPGSVIYHFHIWQLFTYSFIHSDVLHVFFNLMMLAFIGTDLEATWGTARFLKFYFFCTTFAGLTYLFLAVVVHGNMGAPMVGASGGIYGLLMAYGLIYGERLMLFMMLFPLKAKNFVWILAAAEFFSTLFAGRSGLSSLAHLGGMAAGYGYLWGRATWIVMSRQRQEGASTSRRTKRLKSSHLKLIKGEPEITPPDDGGDDGRQNPKTWH